MLKKIGGLLSCLWLFGSFAYAQEAAEQGDAEPSVTAGETQNDAARQDEIDDLEPGVSTESLVAEIRPQAGLSSQAVDELDLGRTEITGNQELPTVLYIVPWQKSDPGEMLARPGNSLLDEVLAPVDRGEFVRQVDYYGDLFEAKEEQ